MKKVSLIIFLFFTLLFVSSFFSESLLVFGQGLEVEYPTIDEYRPITTDPGGFPDYIRYVVRFLTIIAGLVAFGALAYGGFLWMTSEGEPLKLQKSKSRIISSFVGLIIILSSYILLGTIQPTLVELEKVQIERVENVTSPGVYLSLSGSFHEDNEERMRENVRKINASEGGLGGIKGQIQAVRLVNSTTEDNDLIYRHVIILHELENFRGRCRIFANNSSEPRNFNIQDIGENVASITVLRAQRHDQVPYGRVTVYDKPEFQEGSSNQRLLSSPSDSLSPLNVEAWSIDVEGSWAVVLASGSDWNAMDNECAVFATSRSIPTLVGHHMNRCAPYFFSPFFAAYRSCSTHYALFPLYR